MKPTIAFEPWTNDVTDEGQVELIDALWETLQNAPDSAGTFKSTKTANAGILITSSHSNTPLLIASPKALKAYEKHIQDTYCKGINPHIWVQMNRDNLKD